MRWARGTWSEARKDTQHLHESGSCTGTHPVAQAQQERPPRVVQSRMPGFTESVPVAKSCERCHGRERWVHAELVKHTVAPGVAAVHRRQFG